MVLDPAIPPPATPIQVEPTITDAPRITTEPVTAIDPITIPPGSPLIGPTPDTFEYPLIFKAKNERLLLLEIEGKSWQVAIPYDNPNNRPNLDNAYILNYPELWKQEARFGEWTIESIYASGVLGEVYGLTYINNNMVQTVIHSINTQAIDFSPDKGITCPCTEELLVFVSDPISIEEAIELARAAK
jgi:hypothetical protein